MAFKNWFGLGNNPAPKAAVQSSGGGQIITTSDELEKAIAAATVSGTGERVTAETSMHVSAVYACVRIRSGVVANMPLHIKKRIDSRTREDASDHPLWKIFRRKPNRWQTPSQFKRMMTAHLLLRGNAYAMVVRSRGSVLELVPLNPDRVVCKQNNDLSLGYIYTRLDGGKVTLKQDEVMHLVGLTLDGVHGVSVITYARETIGLSLAMERHGSTTFKNGARPSNVLTHPNLIGPEASDNLRASLDAYRTGGDNEGKTLILEEGMKVEKLSMSAEDAQWIESRQFSRTDIAMFFGVPPHMIGDTAKSTSWGTGIDSQTQGFVAFTAEDDLTTWEETINRDLVRDDEPNIYSRFNRASLVRGDIKSRWEAHVKALQWGVSSPNEIRAVEDQNPREDGDIYYDPPNTAGGSENSEGGPDEPTQTPEG